MYFDAKDPDVGAPGIASIRNDLWSTVSFCLNAGTISPSPDGERSKSMI